MDIETIMIEMEMALLVGQKMRAAQVRYFKTRSRDDLVESKMLEAQFDAAAKDVLKKVGRSS